MAEQGFKSSGGKIKLGKFCNILVGAKYCI